LSEIIYKDNDIEFSADDIYIGKDNNGLLCFFIDTSKYFDIRYATFNKGCTYFNYKTKKINKLIISKIVDYGLIDILTFLKKNIDIGYYSNIQSSIVTRLKLFPADYVSYFTNWTGITTKNYLLATHNYDVNYKHSDNYKFIKNRYKKLSKKACERRIIPNNLKAPLNRICKKYNAMKQKKSIIVYKKLKSFSTLYSRPVFVKPFELIIMSILSSIEKKNLTDYATHINLIFDGLSNKKKYRITRRIFVLAKLHRYDDIRNWFANGFRPNTKQYNFYIDERILARYDSMFSLLCNSILSYTFNDVKRKDDIFDNYQYNDESSNKNAAVINTVIPAMREHLNNYKLNNARTELKNNNIRFIQYCRENLGKRAYNISVKYQLLDDIKYILNSDIFREYHKINMNINNQVTYAFYKPINIFKLHVAKINHEEYNPEEELSCLIFVNRK
jgi:hypothetical protein